jgi:DNA-binding XRE family transcriptional regulator
MTTGEKIAFLRNARQLTQEELVDAFNRFSKDLPRITRHQLAHWETDAHTPEWPAAKVIVKYFRITLDDLFFDDRTDFIPKSPTKIKRKVATRSVR